MPTAVVSRASRLHHRRTRQPTTRAPPARRGPPAPARRVRRERASSSMRTRKHLVLTAAPRHVTEQAAARPSKGPPATGTSASSTPTPATCPSNLAEPRWTRCTSSRAVQQGLCTPQQGGKSHVLVHVREPWRRPNRGEPLPCRLPTAGTVPHCGVRRSTREQKRRAGPRHRCSLSEHLPPSRPAGAVGPQAGILSPRSCGVKTAGE